jgi:tRNA threonylcarbamoyladenosine biosynthesis protein TsaB
VLVLAFDTSGFAGSVALLDGPQLLAEETLDRERRSAQMLAPAIARLLAAQKTDPSRIGLVATTVGPGSFTGLRVGVTTAKAFAYAAQADVIGLSTLEVLAHQTPAEWLGTEPREIQAILDAQRKELFVGRFHGAPGLPIGRIEPDHLIAAETWLQSLPAGAIVTGTGVEKLLDRLPQGVSLVPAPLREPQAAMVGRLAWREHERGRRDDLWKLAPEYLRPSYAEEKAAKAPSLNPIK